MKKDVSLGVYAVMICLVSLFALGASAQSNDALYERAYSLWSSRNSEDKAKADEIFKSLAQDGYEASYAYAALAWMNEDDTDSFEIYGDLALDNGGSWIGKQLGDHYYKAGKFVKAARSYKGALNSGWKSYVAYKLGLMHEEGQGVEKDLDSAKEYYRIAAQDLSYIHAKDAYSRYAALGGGALYDPEKFHAAESGIDRSLTAKELFQRGGRLMDGFGSSEDVYKGYAYIKASADKGYPEAMKKLAEIYESHKYGLYDEEAAQRYGEMAVSTYKRLASRGDGDACNELGNCYKRGYLTPLDKELSEKYYMQGAKLGHWHCLRYCGEIYEARGDYARALEYYNKAVEKNEMMAAYSLANMYFEGKGVKKDVDLAIELYKRCARSSWSCSRDAVSRLRELGAEYK